MKRAIFVLLLTLGIPALTPGCVPRDSLITTPEGKRAYTIDQVVKRLGEFQQAIIDASNSGQLPVSDARVVVTFIAGDTSANPPALGAVDLLNSAVSNPNWKPILADAWKVARTHLLNTSLGSWVPEIDTLLAGVTQ